MNLIKINFISLILSINNNFSGGSVDRCAHFTMAMAMAMFPAGVVYVHLSKICGAAPISALLPLPFGLNRQANGVSLSPARNGLCL